jgi:hypothetical protein
MTSTRRRALRRIASTPSLSSGMVTCRPPARVTSCMNGPPGRRDDDAPARARQGADDVEAMALDIALPEMRQDLENRRPRCGGGIPRIAVRAHRASFTHRRLRQQP